MVCVKVCAEIDDMLDEAMDSTEEEEDDERRAATLSSPRLALEILIIRTNPRPEIRNMKTTCGAEG
jgi:hypothetical protein